MDESNGMAAESAPNCSDEPAAALLAMLARLHAGDATGFACVELLADGRTHRQHVHGSACTDPLRTLGALTALVHGVTHAIDG